MVNNDNGNGNGEGAGQAARKPATTGGGGVASAPVLGWGERASMFVDETGYTPVPEGGEATAIVSAGIGVGAYERFKELLGRDVVRCVSVESFSDRKSVG